MRKNSILVIASTNKGKVGEISRILSLRGLNIKSLADFDPLPTRRAGQRTLLRRRDSTDGPLDSFPPDRHNRVDDHRPHLC